MKNKHRHRQWIHCVLYGLSLLFLRGLAASDELPGMPSDKPVVFDGTWHLNMSGIARFNHLYGWPIRALVNKTEQIKVSEAGQKINEIRTEFTVVEVMSGLDKRPELKLLKRIIATGRCDLKQGDNVLMIIDDEGMNGSYVLKDMRLPHKYCILLPTEAMIKKDEELGKTIEVLFGMLRKNIMFIPQELSIEQLKSWAWVDPVGLSEKIIEEIECRNLKLSKLR